MTLTDAGPLVALVDKRDAKHVQCSEAARRMPGTPLLTTWPCLTEAMYFIGLAGGSAYQAKLWQMVFSKVLVIHDLTEAEIDRMAELMTKYSSVPMDLADASLVVVAESMRMKRIFTVDSDFYIYRLADGSALEVVPK